VAAAATPPRSCSGGRFLPTTPPAAFTGAAELERIDALVLGSPGMLIGPCQPGVTRVKARRGFTQLRAHWPSCGALRDVRITAKILHPDCREMRGMLRARRLRARPFTASLSVCGDGRHDAGSEECDAGIGCTPPRPCSAACTCEPLPTTTTSLEPATSTTTTTPNTVTTTTFPPSCRVVTVPFEGQRHVDEGTPVDYVHNPPASGPHYPVWARYQEHTAAVARPYWVHNLEHGAIVLLYHPGAPAETIAALRDAYRALPLDPSCGHTRALLTPDPLLDRPFAVVAANHVLVCAAVNTPAIIDFTLVRRNMAVEDACADGTRP
jgi:hypothetical protein